ncbi:MarR family winged helix-turn-helix transcriptional regulator [Domibacillus indicus]|uniref:MarR family winged helix-turn-helix transcriptional regulator n=1 Tax=Domibacillus indicus TaxID=1437523 RepID=UPI000617C475|nr:MarR family transcriptional regulator [Domibacillus indicus]
MHDDKNLTDLLSDKHIRMRQKVRTLWQETGQEDISQAESHLLALLEREPETIAGAARKMNISRQAVHKCAKGLIQKQYIDDKSIQKNERDKVLMLTDKGKAFCEEMTRIKKKAEEDAAKEIGQENVELLKQLLQKKWGE